MREAFYEWKPTAKVAEVVATANTICAEYAAQGFNLTLRQLYYQFVARDYLPNRQQSYKRLGGIVNEARMSGMMDWDYLEDRGRNVRGSFSGWGSPGYFISRMADDHYSEALWLGQQFRPEVWVEKEALVDVVARGCEATRTPFFACKGYVSQSEMYDAAKRMQRRRAQGLTPVIIHLGDHDPSGMDMTRDIRERLSLMSYSDVEVRRIALNMDQIQQYDPPPNPAKLTDSRGAKYVEEYGDESWELDALEPAMLAGLIREEIDGMVDPGPWAEAVEAENANRARLGELAARYDDLDDNWDSVLEVLDNA